MKRCPECRRDYYDDSLMYCLDDGSALLEGPRGAEAPTEIFEPSSLGRHGESQTKVYPPPTETLRQRQAETASWRKLNKKSFIAVVVVVILFSGGGYLAYRYYTSVKAKRSYLDNVKLTRVTSEGNVESVTISPDGKYIAYTLLENGKRSLWTKHLATNSRVQIVPPTEGVMHADAFSTDGSYVFYSEVKGQNLESTFYKVPVLGGNAQKILTDCLYPTFSPDGKQIAFYRYASDPNRYQHFMANSDGSNERLLHELQEPEWFSGNSAWSPDGSSLAVSYGSEEGGEHMEVGVITVADGNLRTITSKRWFELGRVAWLPDGSGLMVVGQEQPAGDPQISRVGYPSGETQRVTNDLTSYDMYSLSLTAGADAAVALQYDASSSLWLAPNHDVSRAVSVSTLKNAQEARRGVAVDANGRVVYVSLANGQTEIWMTEAGGSPRQLGEDVSVTSLSITPDDRYITFVSLRTGVRQVWRTDLDGSNPKQLTNDPDGVYSASLSRDGRWVFYQPFNGEIWKVSIDGGAAVKIPLASSGTYPFVSPDGRLLAFASYETKKASIQIVKIDGENATPFKKFDMPLTAAFTDDSFYRWAPDGRSIVFVNTIGEVSNLWQLPLDDGKPKQITDFKSQHIWNFAYSPDGKMLAMARGDSKSDVVLINEVKP
jgi:Tol biopolymer transport system component